MYLVFLVSFWEQSPIKPIQKGSTWYSMMFLIFLPELTFTISGRVILQVPENSRLSGETEGNMN